MLMFAARTATDTICVELLKIGLDPIFSTVKKLRGIRLTSANDCVGKRNISISGCSTAWFGSICTPIISKRYDFDYGFCKCKFSGKYIYRLYEIL